MNEVYRLRKGELVNKTLKLPIDFGIVLEEDGLFYFDLYVAEEIDFRSLVENHDNDFFDHFFTLTIKTDDKNELVAKKLSISQIQIDKGKISLVCHDHFIHKELNNFFNPPEKQDQFSDMQSLYYIELEGLRMEFCDVTEKIISRRGKKVGNLRDHHRDHTRSGLIYNSSISKTTNYFTLLYSKKENSDNIIVRLEGSYPNILFYEVFKEFRLEFIYLLALLNGAEVRIRKEYTGKYYNPNTPNSQEIITYSFKAISNYRYSDYIPLNDPINYGKNILNLTFINCFDKFVQLNKQLDFNSIIFYLNGAGRTKSLAESFFIQMIAFERISQKYIDSLPSKEKYWIKPGQFSKIEKELIAVLNSNKDIIGDVFQKILEKIKNINYKKITTQVKFLELLHAANIKISPQIKHILENVRHRSIHMGEIGEGDQAYINAMVLDKLLRDILLNLIGYRGLRKKVEFI